MGARQQLRTSTDQPQHSSSAKAAAQAAPSPGQVRGRPSQFVQQYSAVGVQAKAGHEKVRGPSDEADVHVGDGEEPAVREEREVPLGGETGIVNTKSGNLNLREAPGEESKQIDKFPAGTVMTRHAQKGKWLKVKVWSGHDGKEGWIHGDYFLLQPGLTLNDEEGPDKGKPDDYVFTEVTGQPFHGAPSADQAAQGAIGDCYLIAAMGALAARPGGSKKIMEMIKPHGPSKSYTVTFQEEQRDGSYKPVSVKVDMWLPAKEGNLRYALMGKPTGNLAKVPLWPAIVEKAYAQWKGGYESIGGGGSPGGAMSEMAGVDVENKSVSWFRTDEELLAAVKAALDAGQALTAATKGSLKREKAAAFSGSGTGPYTAALSNVVVAGSAAVRDTAGKAPRVTDDGKGVLSSAAVGPKKEKATGTVEYKRGGMSVSYPDGFVPGKAGDLLAEYEAKYWLSDSPKICGHHAYIVEGVTAAGIKLLNPWGSYHPGEVPIKTFRECYVSFSGAKLPKEVVAEA